MITTVTPLRRVAVTLVLTGVTAFGAVSLAPAAFAGQPKTVTTATVSDPAPVVIGQDGLPVQPPKVCTEQELADYAAKLAAATAQAAPLQRNAAKVANSNAASRLADQAQSLIAKKAGTPDCVVLDEPNGRF
jgi:hypothetical protein